MNMITFMQPLIALLSGFLFMLILVPALKHIALKFNHTDKPNKRKLHAEAVPLIGGIAVFFSLFFTALLAPILVGTLRDIAPVFAFALVLFIVGVIDDHYDLPAKSKLAVQLLGAFSIAAAGIRISSFYGFLGIYALPIPLQYVFTIIMVTGAINAFNLIDGIDGLAGTLSLIGFVIIGVFSFISEKYGLFTISAAFIGGIIGFLKFNLGKHKIFLGDAGSLFIGATLTGAGIYLLNQPSTHSSLNHLLLVGLLSFFALPVLDSLRVYLGRIKAGKSPFKADKTHLHHLLLIMGLNHKKVAVTIAFINFLFVALCMAACQYASLSTIVLGLVLVFSLLGLVLNSNRKLHEWLEKIKAMES